MDREMLLTRDEQAVIEAYRRAKREGDVLRVVCRGRFVKIYQAKERAESVEIPALALSTHIR